jgi:hypothetical protein
MSIIDMHIHLKSRSPCSILSENQLFNNVSNSIEGICITDHWILKPLTHLKYYNVKVYFGVEITTDLGDVLAYGIKKLPSKSSNAQNVIDFIHQQGGIAICAHPFSNRHFAFGERVYEFEFDAIELNGAIGKKYNELARKAALIMDLPTVGGSDSHSKDQLNTKATKFNRKVNSLRDIIKCVNDNECKAINL